MKVESAKKMLVYFEVGIILLTK